MCETATVTITQGTLRGRKVTLKCGTTYFSFQGIPYAKPPVGPLRFKAPEPAEPWTGVRDALVEGPIAPQIYELLTKEVAGDEDCLFLNVYTPKLPESKGDGHRLPVLAFIHGGGFYLGSGNEDFLGPNYFMTEDIILVTFNYRLGPLGFLSTGDDIIPGNNGLKDQVQALQWIQENIAKFGGDPKNVTLGGMSAGAGSAHYHMLSPMSKGLFHKVILQSGTALCTWAFADALTSRNKAFRFGATLGCKTNSSEELLEFLSKVPVKKLVEEVKNTLLEEEKHPLPMFFKPTEEVSDQIEEKFLPGKPKDLIKAGNFYKVPMIIGVTSEEGMFVLKDVNDNIQWYEELNNNFEIILPKNLNLERGTSKSKELAEKVKKFYFGDKSISAETSHCFSKYYSDMLFIAGTSETIKKQLLKSSEPIYMYMFSYEGGRGFPNDWLGDAALKGVSHGNELPYLFQLFFNKDKDLDPESEDGKTTRRAVRMWANFARTGNPTPIADPLLQGVTWSPVTASEPTKHLDIGSTLKVCLDIVPERIAFWEEIYKSAE